MSHCLSTSVSNWPHKNQTASMVMERDEITLLRHSHVLFYQIFIKLATKSECSFVFFLRLSSDTSEPMVPEDSLQWTTSLSPRSVYLTLTTTSCLTRLPPPPHLHPQTHPRLQPYPRPQLHQPTPVRYLT